MKETDEQIVANLLIPIYDLSTTQKRMLLEKLFRKYWDERVTAESITAKVPFKSTSGFVSKLLTKIIKDPNEELEQIYIDAQTYMIQMRQAISQGIATEKQINQQIDKHSEINETLNAKLSTFNPNTEQNFILDIQNQIDERESAVSDLVEQASEAKKNNDHLRRLLKEIEEYASKAYTFKQVLRARLKAAVAYSQAKQLLDNSFSSDLESELSKFELIVLETESKQNLPSPQKIADEDSDLLAKSIPIIERNTLVLERVEELLKNLECKSSNIKT